MKIPAKVMRSLYNQARAAGVPTGSYSQFSKVASAYINSALASTPPSSPAPGMMPGASPPPSPSPTMNVGVAAPDPGGIWRGSNFPSFKLPGIDQLGLPGLPSLSDTVLGYAGQQASALVPQLIGAAAPLAQDFVGAVPVVGQVLGAALGVTHLLDLIDPLPWTPGPAGFSPTAASVQARSLMKVE